jgi:hypothetical protein
VARLRKAGELLCGGGQGASQQGGEQRYAAEN